MNKILVDSKEMFPLDEKVVLSDSKTYDLEVKDSKREVFLSVMDSTEVEINILLHQSSFHFHITLGNQSKLTLKILGVDSNIHLDTCLEQEDSDFECLYSLISKTPSNNSIHVTHLAGHTTSNMKNHGYSLKGAELIFDVASTITKEATKCISHQDNQMIQSQNSTSKIYPNLYIDNYDVDASHSAYVGEFREEELFIL